MAQIACTGIYTGCFLRRHYRLTTDPAGWTEDDTKSYTGPNLSVVTKLAENMRAKLGSTYTVCESGTAGPTGGSSRNRTP